ncbi:MAG: hypothetical protein A2790_23735 [Phenylobacterium sp. RIFCSPHIGHO2_01_FULL_69_31]|nr:MAG: hypothetical protein A2790_23735 [Phenylobacterium sp. RIFCSPHIGHO2_01_FULL_69_31]
MTHPRGSETEGEFCPAMTRITLYVALGALAAAGLSAAPARAQTAYEINRLNQAVQICNSPMGAGLAECAQLRAKLGLGGVRTAGPGLENLGLGGLGGGKAAAAAGIAGVLSQALGAARSQPAVPPPAPPADAGPSPTQPSPQANPFGTLLPRR